MQKTTENKYENLVGKTVVASPDSMYSLLTGIVTEVDFEHMGTDNVGDEPDIYIDFEPIAGLPTSITHPDLNGTSISQVVMDYDELIIINK